MAINTPQLWSTGPAHMVVGFSSITGPIGTPLYLGTAEESPKIDIRPNYEPVYNDLVCQTPFDPSFQGEEAFLAATLTRWNEQTYAGLSARPRPFSTTATRGVTRSGDIGLMPLTEGWAPTLWVLFPYAAKSAMAGMPAGYRFVSATP